MRKNTNCLVFFLHGEPERCFCLSETKGKNREAGPEEIFVRKFTEWDIGIVVTDSL
jgi:hypothetical protein